MIIQILTIIGSIGLFLYGLRLMSEGLQKIAGDSMDDVHTAMTHNRFTGMLTGMLVTALVQSSSATTVMVLSFVNAGLVSLAESMAVIMGANVGTTATTWIIATLGFTFDVALYIFPLLAIALPLFQSNNNRRNSWGELLIGFSLLFLGLGFLKSTLPDLSLYPDTLAAIQSLCNLGYVSLLIFMLFGILLTFLVQASSATFAFALLMCANSWITFDMGCAIVLGSNIGTCLAPMFASRRANTMARRAALGNLLFNVFGSIWTIAIFFLFCDGIAWICTHIGLGDPNYEESVPMGLALFHTGFNLINLLILLPLTGQFVKIITRLIPDNSDKQEAFKLQYISNGMLISTGQIALVQVRKETSRYAEETHKMFQMIQSMIIEPLGSEKQLLLHGQITEMEAESDRAEVEIANFLNQISHKSLSWDGELMSRNLYKMVDELESIADSIFHMSTTLVNKQEQLVLFSAEMNDDIRKMFSLTESMMAHMCHVLDLDDIPSNALNKAYNIEDEINNYRNQLRNAMLDRINLKQVEYMQNTYFMMLVNECEKIGDYAINVIAAACEN